jgi:hypothetical protein
MSSLRHRELASWIGAGWDKHRRRVSSSDFHVMMGDLLGLFFIYIKVF